MAEITIRGAGIFGLSIAWVCAQRGAAVHVIDPGGPGAGSSGGVVGALAPHVPENWNPKKAFQLESLLMAQGFWQDVEAAGGQSAGYARTGRLQPIADARMHALAAARSEGAKELWQGQASWTIEPATGGEWEPPTPSGWLVRDTLSGRMHPRQACAALVAALKSKGVTVAPDGPDRGRVVWATGIAGLEALNQGRPRIMGAGVKGQAAVFEYDARTAPQLFTEGLHIIPHSDGTVAVGSTSERDYANGATTDGQIDTIIATIRTRIPALANAPVIEKWAGVRPRSRSRAPMLGAWPDRPGHYIANGGFKIGFGMAPKVAQVMADLLLEDLNQIPTGFEVEASF